MDERDLPRGRLGRMMRLAATGLRTGASVLLDRDEDATARQAAMVLGSLRGLAAKVGQMASYVDGVVPEDRREVWEGAMKGLRAAAPRSSPREVAAVIARELGAAPEALFARWEPEPFASASIGQVHRAWLDDGRAVAVKVQHPGVAEAVESDLANAGVLESLMGAMGAERFKAHEALEVFRARFREELDYGLEAKNIARFAALFEGDPRVNIPRVVADRSSARVITTDFVAGHDFDAACAAPEAERRAWAETLWRFVFRGNLAGGCFNADPHPGNYVFHDDGRVSFLDFGCVQVISPPRLVNACEVHRAALARDTPRFRRAAAVLTDARPGRMEAPVVDYVSQCFRPLTDAPYRVTRPWAASLVAEMKRLAIEGRKVPADEFFTAPMDMVFMNRLQFGFYSVLARLDVTVDYHAVESAFAHEFAA